MWTTGRFSFHTSDHTNPLLSHYIVVNNLKYFFVLLLLRCKVFVKKEKNYTERGVGTLFIKKVGEDKHQLLVRAETVLGNVLVNVLLSSGIPAQRMGKNNVMLVCLPTPQDVPPPTTVLLRVKTAEEADDLLATLLKYTNWY